MFGPPKKDIFSDHLLWSIFQSSLHTYYKLQSFHMLDLCGQLSCTSSTPVFLTCGCSSCLYFCFNVSSAAHSGYYDSRLTCPGQKARFLSLEHLNNVKIQCDNEIKPVFIISTLRDPLVTRKDFFFYSLLSSGS